MCNKERVESLLGPNWGVTSAFYIGFRVGGDLISKRDRKKIPSKKKSTPRETPPKTTRKPRKSEDES